MSDEDPILPTLGQVIGRAKDALVAERPSAAKHIESGRYATIIAGWRAQFAVARSHQAQHVLAARLPTSTGQALTELTRSDYDTERNVDVTRAVGEVVLTRTVVHYVAGSEISTADATDSGTLNALLEAIRIAVNAHILSVYNSTTGLGAHQTADSSGVLTYATTNMLALITAANNFKLKLNRHLANMAIANGAAGTFHKDSDTENVITEDDATDADSSADFDSASASEQAALLTLVNAIKAAYNAHVALEAKAGTVRAGTAFRVDPAPTAVPPVTGGQYVVMVDTYARRGDQEIQPPIEATVDGPGQNLPIWSVGGAELTIKATSPLFDSGATLPFAVTALYAAGGSNGQTDPELRRASTASWTGTYGPTGGALAAGALRSQGVSHLRVPENRVRGGSVVYCADGTWSWSARFAAGVERELRDGWLGQGCRLSSGRVVNRIVRVEATIALRDADLLVDPSAITTSLNAACQGYFDDRPDWHIWRTATLRAVLSRANRSILRCSDVKVLDYLGQPIAEPDEVTLGVGDPPDITHWYFAENALLVSYVGPT